VNGASDRRPYLNPSQCATIMKNPFKLDAILMIVVPVVVLAVGLIVAAFAP
jgi:hypothetical protein